jgi:ABC-type uncharacterized transport system ATPase subunit
VYLTDAAAFEREAKLVYDVIRRCKAEGRTAVFLIDHLMRAVDLLLTRDVCDDVVNIASGQPEDIELIVNGLEQRLGTRAERTLVDGKPAKRSVASIAKLRKLAPEIDDFGFGPGYVPALLDRYVDDLAAHARKALA